MAKRRKNMKWTWRTAADMELHIGPWTLARISRHYQGGWVGTVVAFEFSRRVSAGRGVKNYMAHGKTQEETQAKTIKEVRRAFREVGLEDAMYWPGEEPREANALVASETMRRRINLE